MNMLRRIFKYFNHFMLWMWRRGWGKMINFWPEVGGRIMVITTIGRKSGQARYTPVNYFPDEGAVYCLAGFGQISDWYNNLKVNPAVQVWLPDGKWNGVAEEIDQGIQWLSILRQVLKCSGFASFLAGINPYSISDSQLAQVCRDYRLIHISLHEAVRQ